MGDSSGRGRAALERAHRGLPSVVPFVRPPERCNACIRTGDLRLALVCSRSLQPVEGDDAGKELYEIALGDNERERERKRSTVEDSRSGRETDLPHTRSTQHRRILQPKNDGAAAADRMPWKPRRPRAGSRTFLHLPHASPTPSQSESVWLSSSFGPFAFSGQLSGDSSGSSGSRRGKRMGDVTVRAANLTHVAWPRADLPSWKFVKSASNFLP